MELIALISTGKGTWNEVSSIINNGEWEKVILVGEEYARKFDKINRYDFVQVNFNQPVELIKKEIISKLKNKLSGTEVALSIASGSGNEHIALISALLQIPVGVKFVTFSEKGVIEL